jgi:hypothetical protein
VRRSSVAVDVDESCVDEDNYCYDGYDMMMMVLVLVR